MRDLYQVLGVTANADDGDIKGAFHSLAKTFHPDVNSGNALAEQRFKEIGQAYDTLKDPKTRAAYELGLVHQRKLAQRRIGVAAMTGFATSMFSTIVISLVMIWFLTDGRQVSAGQDRDAARPAKTTSAPQEGRLQGQGDVLAKGVPSEIGELP